MKTALLILTTALGLGSSAVTAQNQSQVWAQITDRNVFTLVNADGQLVSNNNQLNETINLVGIQSINAALPASKNEMLLSVYEFSCACEESTLRNALGQISFIKGIETAPRYEALYTPNDYSLAIPTDYALNLIGAQGAWDITQSNPNIIIGISDQNVSVNHEDLQGKIVHYDASNTTTPTHGTAVSIIAAGNTDNNQGLSSIGFNSSIAFYQMNYNEILSASYSGLDVINISWTSGCFFNPYEQAAVSEAYDNGTFLIAAAGNGNTCGSPDALVYPSAYADVFAVTSIGANDNHEQISGDPSSTHQHNSTVDLAAPGYLVGVSPATGWYLASSGTSFAAPFVSGTVALMLSVNPCLTNDAIESILKNSSMNIDAQNPQYTGKIGSGRLNAQNAVVQAQMYGNPTLFNASVSTLCAPNTGFISLNPSNSTPNYSVIWSNGLSGLENGGLANGSYTLSLTDAHGCVTDTTITIGSSVQLMTAGVVSNITCNNAADGAIDVSIIQGTPAYSYSWDNGANTQDLTNLDAGVYRLTVIDASGCSVMSSFTVTEPTALVINAMVNDAIGGNNGSIDLTATGGLTQYAYNWSNGATTEDLTQLSAGNYDITLSDANGCIANAQFTVNGSNVSGIEEESALSLNIYPNPSQGEVNLTWTGQVEEIRIFDQQGKLVQKDTISGLGGLKVNELTPGIYMVNLIGTKGVSTTERLIVL